MTLISSFAVEHEPRESGGVVGGPQPETDEVAPRAGPRPGQDRLDALSPGKCIIQSGASGCEKGFVKCFLKVLSASWAARQLQYSPITCGNLRKKLQNLFYN